MGLWNPFEHNTFNPKQIGYWRLAMVDMFSTGKA